MTSSFLSYADDRFQFLHVCTYVCVDWGLHGSEARKRSGWGRGKIRPWTPCDMREEGEQLEEEGDEQEEAGLGVEG